jgi:hypothetical protein
MCDVAGCHHDMDAAPDRMPDEDATADAPAGG